jgi:hypothetical protein
MKHLVLRLFVICIMGMYGCTHTLNPIIPDVVSGVAKTEITVEEAKKWHDSRQAARATGRESAANEKFRLEKNLKWDKAQNQKSLILLFFVGSPKSIH